MPVEGRGEPLAAGREAAAFDDNFAGFVREVIAQTHEGVERVHRPLPGSRQQAKGDGETAVAPREVIARQA